jgi:hypothetical protein
MNLEVMRNFNRSEKVALLKLIIKVAAADNKITKEEQAKIKEFLNLNHLKISNEYVKEAMAESYDNIVSVFTNKSNINRAHSIVKDFAKVSGINPEYEGRALDEIKLAFENKKKTLKFSLSNTVKTFFLEFAFLWGKEDMNPNMKSVLAILFTLLACVFGSLWTSSGFIVGMVNKLSLVGIGNLLGSYGSETKFVSLHWSHVVSGFVIFGALCFRNYLPRPTNIRNVIFSMANLYLLSTIAMHIIGRSGLEKSTTLFIFFGLILLLWLGMKELLGFFFIAFFILLIWKVFQIDKHMAWRAFPFMACAFMGISFQSNNFFNDFSGFTSSFFKKPEIEREMIKESVELAGKRVGQVTKAAISVGTSAATGMPPKALPNA